MNLEPLRNLSPEVLDCLSAHVFALNWLAVAVSRGDVTHGENIEDLIYQAREQGYAAYIATSPADTLEILDKSFNDYLSIVSQADVDTALLRLMFPPGNISYSQLNKPNSDENPDFSTS